MFAYYPFAPLLTSTSPVGRAVVEPVRGHPRHSGTRLAAVLVGCTVVLGPPLPATAACGGPGLSVEGIPEGRPVVLVPGQRVVVLGVDDADGPCDDTPDTGVGCAPAPAPSVPARDVPLQLTQGATSQVLARADAVPDSTARWDAVVPLDAVPGPAVLEADGGRIVISLSPRR